MKKTYYPPNLVSNLSNRELKLKFHEIGYRLNREFYFPTTTDDSAIISIIKEFYTASGIEDPILSVYPNYFVKTPNGIENLQRETHPFYGLFNVVIGPRYYDPLYGYRNSFEITINKEILKGFIAVFIVDDISLIETDYLDDYYSTLFVIALEDLITNLTTTITPSPLSPSLSIPKKLFYSRYSVNKHTEQSVTTYTENPFYYKFESQYNFYNRKYENVFSSGSTLPDSIIPNLYACNSYIYFDEPERIRKVVSLDGRVPITEESLLNEKYYTDYASAVEAITDPAEFSTITKTKNYVLDPANSNISSVPLSSENFPYCVKMKLSNYYSDPVETFMTEKKLNTYVVNNSHYLFNNEISKPTSISITGSNFYVIEDEVFLVPNEAGSYVGGDGRTYDVITSVIQSTQSVDNTDYTNLFNYDSASAGFVVYPYSEYKFYSTENRNYLSYLSRPLSVFTYLNFNSFQKTLSSLVQDYSSVLNLTELSAYNLNFQVEKSVSGSVVNNFSFSRNEDIEFSVDDTQVVYGKTYDYRFYGINYVNSFSYVLSDVYIGYSGTIAPTSSGTLTPPEISTRERIEVLPYGSDGLTFPASSIELAGEILSTSEGLPTPDVSVTPSIIPSTGLPSPITSRTILSATEIADTARRALLSTTERRRPASITSRNAPPFSLETRPFPNKPDINFPTIPTPLPEKSPTPPAIIGTITFEDDTKIYKNFLFDKSFAVFDNPPPLVGIQILPLLNSPNNLLFLLNSSNFSYLEEPRIIYPSDFDYFRKLRIIQDLGTKKILFEGADDLVSVDVFRTTTPPKRYSDFADYFYRSIEFQLDDYGRTSATDFIDSLEFNTKYYYTFRGIDVHNNISNATEVYEVEIVNNDGAIYSIVKNYDLRETGLEYQYTKPFKKYISINPSIFYTSIQQNEEGRIIIGDNNSGMWGEKFKIRVRSKESGKCFDINFTFNKKTYNAIDGTSELNDFEPEVFEPSLDIPGPTTTSPTAPSAIIPYVPVVPPPPKPPIGIGAPVSPTIPSISTSPARPFSSVPVGEDRIIR
jgi:hypothetical protein